MKVCFNFYFKYLKPFIPGVDPNSQQFDPQATQAAFLQQQQQQQQQQTQNPPPMNLPMPPHKVEFNVSVYLV